MNEDRGLFPKSNFDKSERMLQYERLFGTVNKSADNRDFDTSDYRFRSSGMTFMSSYTSTTAARMG